MGRRQRWATAAEIKLRRKLRIMIILMMRMGIMIPVKKTADSQLRKKCVIPNVQKRKRKRRKNILPVMEELFRYFMYTKIL